ncbi:TPA: restriction endonuclease subunit S [Streptococcus suis]|nr:restriction endonuclease subunit S [Streptococcus suis]
MNEWKEVSLSEMGKTITGKTPSSQHPEDFGDEMPFITPSDSFEKKYINKSDRFLSRSGSDRLKEKIISPNSIMVTCIGSAMGKVAKNSLSSVTNQQINSIIVNENFDSDYIYYLLKNNYAVLRNAASGSTAIPILNKTDFDNLRFKVELNLNEQRKMVSILSTIDDKIETNNQINEELEAMAKTLYEYWFVQFDFPDENGKPYKSSGGKMVYNDQLKREIPEGWGVDSLWNIATFYNGLAMQKFRPASETDESLPVIKIREMFSGFSKDTEKASTAIPKEAIIEAGDILFSWSATLEVILWGGEKGALNQHIFKVTSEKYPKSFIYNELRSYLKVFKTIAELRKTTMGHITQDHLKQAMIIVPPNDLIDEIHNRISPILKQQLDLKQQNQELTQLRDWLLPMLMNGQVRVEDKTWKL